MKEKEKQDVKYYYTIDTDFLYEPQLLSLYLYTYEEQLMYTYIKVKIVYVKRVRDVVRASQQARKVFCTDMLAASRYCRGMSLTLFISRFKEDS